MEGYAYGGGGGGGGYAHGVRSPCFKTNDPRMSKHGSVRTVLLEVGGTAVFVFLWIMTVYSASL